MIKNRSLNSTIEITSALDKDKVKGFVFTSSHCE